MPNFEMLTIVAAKIAEYAKLKKLATYGQLSRDIDGILKPRFMGKHLGWISSACAQEGFPMLTTIIVRQDKNTPGDGYYSLYKDINGVPISEDSAWYQECEKVFAVQDWAPVMNRLKSGRV